jgi:hypothetical protein
MPDIRNIIELGRRLDGLFQCRFRRNLPILHQDAGRNTDLENCKEPANGTLKKLDVSSYEYTAKAGYRGPDTFAVQATGTGPTSSGTSKITMNATVK